MSGSDIGVQLCSDAPLSQVDGSADYQQHRISAPIRNSFAQPGDPLPHPPQGFRQHRTHSVSTSSVRPCHQTRTSGNAVSDLLPYCTTEPPLNEERVIALSDAVGSLKELVLLSLGAAAGEVGYVERLEGAVGGQAAARIAGFFVDELEVEG